MAINRVELVKRHNPTLTGIAKDTPLTVGNGNFAYTADITGMQTLYDSYKEAEMPLCTMSQWGWHTTPVSKEKYEYTYDELIETEYDFCDRKVYYPIECKEGNEAVYHWLRQNPHRLNLARIGLVRIDGDSYCEITESEISDINQVLHMEKGVLESRFCLNGTAYEVDTYCGGKHDAVGFTVRSRANNNCNIAVLIAFPYGSPDISASEWEKETEHETILEKEDENSALLLRTLDKDGYAVTITWEKELCLKQLDIHKYLLLCQEATEEFSFTVNFCRDKIYEKQQALQIRNEAEEFWADYWKKTGVIQLYESKDERAIELERRIVLSQYLMAVNSSGSVPPQETGLTCNSWYGKLHMEMYFWHEAYLPLWGRSDRLFPSLDWCMEHLPEARWNASKNGYKGARWPKMVAADAKDSPSPIAPLLIWQQPHLIYMIYLAYREKKDKSILEKYYPLIEESAEFMVDFAVKNKDGLYELEAPVIPVQECHPPRQTKNPTFEIEYWVVTLRMAAECAKLLGKEIPESWLEVAENMVSSPLENGLYLAHSNCPDTFEKYAKDHPSMLMAYGVIDSGRMDREAMNATIRKAQEVWDYQSLWGWDFAVMAMTATRLGNPEYAIELLLMDTYKNVYVTSGNNRQVSRNDLPLYLPGNGSLLLAVSMMAAGYDSCTEECPGFPKDGNWKVEYEGILPMP